MVDSKNPENPVVYKYETLDDFETKYWDTRCKAVAASPNIEPCAFPPTRVKKIMKDEGEVSVSC